jgi:acyl carrier protein
VSSIGADDVRRFILEHLAEQLRVQGRSLPTDLPDDYDLMLSGLIDSLDLLELMTALAEHCGGEIDFEAIDPDQMTILGPLSRFVAEEAARS